MARRHTPGIYRDIKDVQKYFQAADPAEIASRAGISAAL
jgi:hypothetical protein